MRTALQIAIIVFLGWAAYEVVETLADVYGHLPPCFTTGSGACR